MRRREFVGVTGSAIAAGLIGGSGCMPARRLRSAIAPLRDLMAPRVAQHQFPGAVWLVAQGDEVAADAIGVTAIDGTTPMRRDTVFRIASMTKAVTATAVLLLVEQGKLALDAPAER